MSRGVWNRGRNLYGPRDLLLVAAARAAHSALMRPIIGRLTATNWVAHLALILAAAVASAVLASHPIRRSVAENDSLAATLK